jgi:hypothetical protein
LLLAIVTGSVGLPGGAIHNLSDVSTSAVVFLSFRLSQRPPTERSPYGLERAEDLAGIGIAVIIWASVVFAAAVIGILGNQIFREPRPKYGVGPLIRAEHHPAYGRIDQFCDRGRRGVSQGRSITSAVAAPSGRRADGGRRLVGGGGQRDEVCPGRL